MAKRSGKKTAKQQQEVRLLAAERVCRAAVLLAQGHSVLAAAEAVRARPATISAWAAGTDFGTLRAAVTERRRVRDALARLGDLTPGAIDALRRALEGDDLGLAIRAAREVLERIGPLAQSGAVAVWVGEQGVRYYAHGTGLARSTRLLEAQAELVSHRDKRLSVARRMYEQRFPDDAVDRATMQQLRGREGARVRRIYREHSGRTGVQWRRRDYDPDHFDDGDAINQALSAAHTSLYGVVHSIVVALGCSPGLGFIHTGHHRAFVYDIADLYKAEVTIPIAFEVVAAGSPEIPADTRRAVRDAMRSGRIIERCVRDIRSLLGGGTPTDEPEWDIVHLWDDTAGEVMGGVAYGEEPF